MSLLLVGVGVSVALTFFVGPPEGEGVAAQAAQAAVEPGSPGASGADGASGDRRETGAGIGARGGQPVSAESPAIAVKPEKGSGGPDGAPKERAYDPGSRMLRVTIPDMARVRRADVPYAAGDDDDAFHDNAGVHLEGTGDPWDKEANVYIAGHRLGYPRTESWLAFWDLNELENGDRIVVEDAKGGRYVYKVYEEFIVDPEDVRVTQPVDGKNVLTLQTCTLPDYSRRLIVRAEKVRAEKVA